MQETESNVVSKFGFRAIKFFTQKMYQGYKFEKFFILTPGHFLVGRLLLALSGKKSGEMISRAPR